MSLGSEQLVDLHAGRDRDGGGLGMLVMAIVAPIAAMMIQFAISRQNEFQADRTGAEISGNPLGLASALRKMDAYSRRIPMQLNPAAASLAIVNPLAGQKSGFIGLFMVDRTGGPVMEPAVVQRHGFTMPLDEMHSVVG